MDQFFSFHPGQSKWIVLALLSGLVVTAVWAARFRALRGTAITAPQLRAEAWRGVIGAGAWLVWLGCIFFMLLASGEINYFEALANSDEISESLTAAIAEETRTVGPAAAVSFGLAISAIFLGGWWSGALTILRGREVRYG